MPWGPTEFTARQSVNFNDLQSLLRSCPMFVAFFPRFSEVSRDPLWSSVVVPTESDLRIRRPHRSPKLIPMVTSLDLLSCDLEIQFAS